MSDLATMNGATSLIGMAGHPIAQARTPALMNRRFAAAGLNRVVVPLDLPPVGVDAAWSGLRRLDNFVGLIVTVPHKPAFARLADRRSPTVERVGAANALRRERDGVWHAEMFDGLGLVAALHARQITIEGRCVLLVGAGGAGSAIADAIAIERPAGVRIFDRDRARMLDLVATLRTNHPGLSVESGTPGCSGIDLLIQATPVGMDARDPLPVDLADLAPETVVADIIAAPGETRLVKRARARGCAVVTGAAMIDGQADLLFKFLTD